MFERFAAAIRLIGGVNGCRSLRWEKPFSADQRPHHYSFGNSTMSRTTFVITLSLAVCVLAPARFVAAQQATPAAPPSAESGYYYGPTTPAPQTPSFSQQKARLRAEQRIARLEAHRRYGLTPNRPTAEALPYTSAYPLVWLRRGSSPLVSFHSNRPLMYYAHPYTVYR
jgi:hypothetical protein